MRPVETALLFVTNTKLSLVGFCDRLNRELKAEGVTFWPVMDTSPAATILEANGFRLTIHARNKPLPGETFTDALDGFLSEPYRGPLSDVLHRHRKHISVTLMPMPGEGVHMSDEDKLRTLRIAHRVNTILVEGHHPAALHWRNSNQLLLGSQYLNIAKDKEPWALFVRAVATGDLQLQLDLPDELDGQSVVVSPNGFDLAEAYAAGLSFLRHRLRTGEEIPDGHSFGPFKTASAKVSYLTHPGNGATPLAHLTLYDTPFFVSKRVDRPDRPVSTAQTLNALQSALKSREPEPKQPNRASTVAGAAATVAVPPLGLMLVASHFVLGSTIAKSLVVMAGSFVLALGVATFVDLRETAVASSVLPEIVTQDVLADN